MGRRRGPEGKIQDAVIRYAREEHNAMCKKNEAGPYHISGFLDYTIFPDKTRKRYAQVFVVEFKAPGGVLTPKQDHTADELVARGHRVYVISSVERGKRIIDQECSG